MPSGIVWPMLQKVLSWLLIVLMMAATIVVGLVAEGLSSRRQAWWEKFDRESPGNDDGYIDQRCASLALAPLPLIFSYKSEKSLCGTGSWR